MPPAPQTGRIDILTKTEYQKEFDSMRHAFERELGELLQANTHGSGIWNSLKGNYRSERGGIKGRKVYEIEADSAYQQLLSIRKRMQTRLGVSKQTLNSVNELLQDALKAETNQLDSLRTKLWAMTWILPPAALATPLVMAATPIIGTALGFGATTVKAFTAAAGSLALFPFAYQGAMSILNAAISTTEQGGNFFCHLADQFGERATMTVAMAPVLASLPAAILTGGKALTLTGVPAPIALEWSKFLTSGMIATGLGISVADGVQDTYKLSSEAAEEGLKGNEELSNHYYTEATREMIDTLAEIVFLKQSLDTAAVAGDKIDAFRGGTQRYQRQVLRSSGYTWPKVLEITKATPKNPSPVTSPKEVSAPKELRPDHMSEKYLEELRLNREWLVFNAETKLESNGLLKKGESLPGGKRKAIDRAFMAVRYEVGADGKSPARPGNYTDGQQNTIRAILESRNFSDEQIDILIKDGVI